MPAVFLSNLTHICCVAVVVVVVSNDAPTKLDVKLEESENNVKVGQMNDLNRYKRSRELFVNCILNADIAWNLLLLWLTSD